MAKHNPLTEVLTAAEVAELRGVSIRYIQDQCVRGKFEARKTGKTWLILKSSVIPSLPKVEEFKPVIMKMNKDGAIGVFYNGGIKSE